MTDLADVPPPVGPPPFPGLARFGIAVMGFGLLLDLVEHGFVPHVDEWTVAGFPLSEHVAHLVVLVGMILILGGIVRAGMRVNARRPPQDRSFSHAVR